MSSPETKYLVVEENGRSETVDRCAGPDEIGNCPKVSWGDVVPCAGRQLRTANGGGDWRVVVPHDTATCPIPLVQPRRRSIWLLGGMVGMIGAIVGASIATAVTLAVAGGGTQAPASTASSQRAAQRASAGAPAAPAAAPKVTVGVPGDRFAPAYLTVAAGTTVTWNNTDTDPHTVTTAPGMAPVAFDVTLAPGASGSYTFTTPGLYVVYCKAHATWDAANGLAKPAEGTDVFPEAMAGVIAVTGPGTATTAGTSTTVQVPGDHFLPNYLTVAAGTTITWNNTDTDPHTVSTAPGLAPVAFDLPIGASGSVSYKFTTPGLYVIYCKAHATWDAASGQFKPLPGTDVFPEAMAGAVLVVPASS